jgi:hypothetical protein
MPAAGDVVRVYNAGTTTLTPNLTAATTAGGPISNPITVPASGFWGFEPPDGRRLDVYWVNGARNLIADTILEGHIHENKPAVDQLGQANNLPTWAGQPWPGTAGSGDMAKSIYDPKAGNRQVAFENELHGHTQKSTLDKITEANNLPLWNEADWPGIVGGAAIVEQLQNIQPGTSWTITGPKEVGSDPPVMGASTQQMVNWFVARGVPTSNILWNVVGEEGVGGDATPPVITAFSMPASSTSLTVAVTTFTATDDVGVTGYRLTESSSQPALGTFVASKPTQHVFASVGQKTVYPWARDLAGNINSVYATPASINVMAAPNAVTNLTATPGNGEVALNWTKSTGDSTHSPATNYDVKWGTTNPPQNTISNVGDVAYYLKTALTNNTTYYFQVVAKNTAGTAASSTVNAQPIDSSNQAPTQPSNLAASNYLTNGTGYRLSWSAATDPDGSVSYYKVYKGGVLHQNNVSNLYLDITGQAAGSSANWTVSAVDNLALEGAQSTALNVLMLCAAPTGTSAVMASTSANTLNPGSSSGAASYAVYWTSNGTEPTTASSKISGVTNGYSHSGLTYGLTYKYKFVAVNATGESLLSATSTVTIALAAPTGHSVTAGDAKLTINPGTSAGATGYKYYLTDNGTTPSKANYTATGTATADQELAATNNTEYKVVFTATEGANESAESTEISATPAAATGPVLVEDNFNRSNRQLNTDANWEGASVYRITSNAVNANAANNDHIHIYWTPDVVTGAGFVQAKASVGYEANTGVTITNGDYEYSFHGGGWEEGTYLAMGRKVVGAHPSTAVSLFFTDSVGYSLAYLRLEFNPTTGTVKGFTSSNGTAWTERASASSQGSYIGGNKKGGLYLASTAGTLDDFKFGSL